MITFDQELDADSLPDVTAFSLSNDGPEVASVSIEAEELTLNLASTAIEDADYTIAYTGTRVRGLQDPTGNGVVDFSQMVENTTDYAPRVDSVKTNKEGTQVFVSFDQSVLIPDSFENSSFSISPGIGIHSVGIDSSVLGSVQLLFDLDSSTPIREGAEVNLSYRKPASGGLRDDDSDEGMSFNPSLQMS